MAIIITVIIN